MGFGQQWDKKSSDKSENKFTSPFIKVVEDSPVIIRILDEEEVGYYRYWFKVNLGEGKFDGKPIVAGYNSPLAGYLKEIGEGHPRFTKASKRAVINVLERVVDSETGLVSPEPEKNVVKILEFGPQLMQHLKMLHMNVRDRSNYSERLPINRFDIQLIASGKGFEKQIMPMQHDNTSPTPEHLLKLPRYDLRKMYTPLPNEAIQRLIDNEEYSKVMADLGLVGYPTYTP